MSKLLLFDLIRGSLPSDFDPSELLSLCKYEWWQNKHLLACAYSLRNCDTLDWNAYLQNYPDVKEANIDPVLHFLEDGVFEGRKLFTKKFIENNSNINIHQSLVSIVLCNYNKAHFLAHSIGSLLTQSLQDIEIITVDDCSTDKSLSIMRHFASRDARIKVVSLPYNQSLHRVRQEGVKAASGKYIMFLDSDDFYYPNACETAYNAINDKYDFVCFNTNLLFPEGTAQKKKDDFQNYINSNRDRQYAEHEIMSGLYGSSRSMPEVLWNKIYHSTLCKNAFAVMKAIPLHQTEDLYETFVIASMAKSAARIKVPLYNYRALAGQANAENTPTSMERFACAGDAYVCLEEFAHENGLLTYLDSIKDKFFWRAINPWLSFADESNCRWYFNSMARQYGIIDLIGFLIKNFNGQWQRIANKFHCYGPHTGSNKPVKSVGILYTVMGNGGAERVMWTLAELLHKKGYKVTIFLESANENDKRLIPYARVVYLAAYGSSSNRTKLLMQALESQLKQNPVDVMTCHACHYGNLLWQIILLKYLNIPVILFPHSSFFKPLLFKDPNYTLQTHVAVMRLADKVSVLSHYEELFYRQNGVNAQYIPNPVRLQTDTDYKQNVSRKRNPQILVFGRLGEPTKNIHDCLVILKELLKIYPYIKMIFVGSFIDEISEKRFYDQAKQAGVLSSIHVTGWLENVETYLNTSLALLSTAWTESFALTICEAQSHGLPVVMYNLPIESANGNQGIIKIEHGNIKQAVAKLSELIIDEGLRMRMSATGHQLMKRFAPDLYIKKIVDLLENFQHISFTTYYSPGDYEVVMRTLAFYGSRVPPWGEAKQ